jgi:hypothetical protein
MRGGIKWDNRSGWSDGWMIEWGNQIREMAVEFCFVMEWKLGGGKSGGSGGSVSVSVRVRGKGRVKRGCIIIVIVVVIIIIISIWGMLRVSGKGRIKITSRESGMRMRESGICVGGRKSSWGWIGGKGRVKSCIVGSVGVRVRVRVRVRGKCGIKISIRDSGMRDSGMRGMRMRESGERRVERSWRVSEGRIESCRRGRRRMRRPFWRLCSFSFFATDIYQWSKMSIGWYKWEGQRVRERGREEERGVRECENEGEREERERRERWEGVEDISLLARIKRRNGMRGRKRRARGRWGRRGRRGRRRRFLAIS